MTVLYRKYRPQIFSELIGQKAIAQTLKNQIATGQISHAYLFTGGRGVGKTSVARIMAKALNCQTKGSENKVGLVDACGICEICQQIQAGTFLDLVEIDAASNTGVDNIRELIEHVKFAPAFGKYKVFIIDEVHMLSKGAFNALLKTLEEPPRHIIFILATTEINKIPATIISRTQRFDFRAYTNLEIKELLQKVCVSENLKFNPEVFEFLAENAQGSARDALSLLDKVATLGESATLDEYRKLLGATDLSVCADFMDLIITGQAEKIPYFVNSLLESGQDFLVFSRGFLEFLRKLLVHKITQARNEAIANIKIETLASQIKEQEIIFLIKLFLKAYKDTGVSPSPDLPLLLAGLEAALRQKPQDEKHSNLVQADVRTNTDEVKTHNPNNILENMKAVRTTESVLIKTEWALDNVSLEEINLIWPQIVEKLKLVNSPLANLLKTSPPLETQNGTVILGVKFQFHKQSLENVKNLNLLKDISRQILLKNIHYIIKVVKNNDNEAMGEPVNQVADVLRVLGGELVE